ncbi:MAG: hypothetical protein OEW12_03175, partial [Deltaproteobacteria bacterium]|nr:hypothetical protein [Deltaproteobacteria bacterium]
MLLIHNPHPEQTMISVFGFYFGFGDKQGMIPPFVMDGGHIFPRKHSRSKGAGGDLCVTVKSSRFDKKAGVWGPQASNQINPLPHGKGAGGWEKTSYAEVSMNDSQDETSA